MIPKIIHYTWFSGEEMPQMIKDCMASWKRNLVGYEFRLWDINAIKDIDSIFLKEALAVKKWAYAADSVRLYALFSEGGIYLDTDVIIYKSFDDLLGNKVFIGKEDSLNQLPIEDRWVNYLSSHCMGAEPSSEFIRDCLRYFEERHFVQSKDEKLPQSLRYNYVILPYVQAVIAREYGYDWHPKMQSIQYCKDGLVIYPSDYFCGQKYLSKSYCQHLALGSWRGDYTPNDGWRTVFSFKRRAKRFLRNILLKYSYTFKKIG